jgi:hypothetical protein
MAQQIQPVQNLFSTPSEQINFSKNEKYENSPDSVYLSRVLNLIFTNAFTDIKDTSSCILTGLEKDYAINSSTFEVFINPGYFIIDNTLLFLNEVVTLDIDTDLNSNADSIVVFATYNFSNVIEENKFKISIFLLDSSVPDNNLFGNSDFSTITNKNSLILAKYKFSRPLSNIVDVFETRKNPFNISIMNQEFIVVNSFRPHLSYIKLLETLEKEEHSLISKFLYLDENNFDNYRIPKNFFLNHVFNIFGNN